eukprot:6347419-Karenia_brevis.AAC.1
MTILTMMIIDHHDDDDDNGGDDDDYDFNCSTKHVSTGCMQEQRNKCKEKNKKNDTEVEVQNWDCAT